MIDVQTSDLRSIVEAIRNRAISSEEVATTFLRNSKQCADLNAFTSLNEHLVEEARMADTRQRGTQQLGALHGVPLALKDNIGTCALPTTAGTSLLRRNTPVRDARVARRLFDAGALLLGKNTLHELAFGVTCNSPAFGAVSNPYDRRRIPGGSSGGTAVAVAARLAPAGIGTDTGGSVRVPAALCGIAGFRPSVGRWSQEGIVPISATRDTAGPLAHTVGDLLLLDEVVTGDSNPASACDLREMRIGLPRGHFWEGLDAETERLCVAAVNVARVAGAQIVEADIPQVAELNNAISFVIALHEGRVGLGEYLAGVGAEIDFDDLAEKIDCNDVRNLVNEMRGSSAEERRRKYVEVMKTERPAFVRRMDAYFDENALDAMIFPTTPLPACLIGEDDSLQLNNVSLPVFATYIRNTDPGSVAGLPGVTIPAGLTNSGLPVGIALDGPRGSDRRLLALAQSLEAALGRISAPKLDHLRA